MISGYTFRGREVFRGRLYQEKVPDDPFAGVCGESGVYRIFHRAGAAGGGICAGCRRQIRFPLKDRVLGLFLRYQTTDLGGATWFLLVLFEVEVLFVFVCVAGGEAGNAEGALGAGGSIWGNKLCTSCYKHDNASVPYWIWR